MTESDENPRWNGVYTAVLVIALAVMLGLYTFTRYFSA